MFLNVDGKTYVVDFEYDRKVPSEQLTHCTFGEVTARVEREYRVTILGFGTAVCSKNDQFKKAAGRKVSMLRALKKAGLEKDFRKRIWDEYFKQARK